MYQVSVSIRSVCHMFYHVNYHQNDFGANCRMYKGSLKRNGVSFDVA